MLGPTVQAFLCCFDFLLVILLLHHFLLDKLQPSVSRGFLKGIGIVVCSAFLAGVNNVGINWLNGIVAVALNMLLAICFYKGRFAVKFFLAILVAALSMFFEFFVVILTAWILNEDSMAIIAVPSVKIAMIVISKVLLFIVLRILFFFTKGRKYAKSGKDVLCLFILPVVTIGSIALMVNYQSEVPWQEVRSTLLVLVCFGLILCNLAAFYVYDRNLDKYELENRLRETEEVQRVQVSYYKQMESGLQQSRKQLHDFKNHITTLEHLYCTDSKDKALQYIEQLQAQMSRQMAAVSYHVHNTAFDVILYRQEEVCAEHGIIFEKLILYDDLSVFTYMDTCIIFANALDNAVKACAEMESGERKIILLVRRHYDMLYIFIENTKQNAVMRKNGQFLSTKTDGENHGFGIENIKMAVEKYNGILIIEDTECLFSVAISVPLHKEQN